ncbi:KH domain-containing protein-like [Dorcoceras hygrometricum]|uniref:KH domain-containing protein-like n=1 Tax=Dorcoceras hygrometricum TaxID=472368 RepID=A0A2Z7B665_9LAMI|nr:KH domain-containing protein-like [Dorcoceras hygrometricum]
MRKLSLQLLNSYDLLIRSTTGISIPSPICTRKPTKVSRTESPLRNGRNKFHDGGGRQGRRGREKILAEELLVSLIVPSRTIRSWLAPHDPLGITDSAFKNYSVMIDIHAQGQAVNTRQRSIDSYMHRDLTQPRHLMTPTESTSDLIHSTNGNHLESPNEGSSIDHQVTIHLHAQNITMFPTNETWYFTSQMLVSRSGDPYPLLDGPID